MKKVLTEKTIPFIVRHSLNYLNYNQALDPNIRSFQPQAAKLTILFPNMIQEKSSWINSCCFGVLEIFWCSLAYTVSLIIFQQRQTVCNSGLPGHWSMKRTVLPKICSAERLYQEIWLRHSQEKTRLAHSRQANVVFAGKIYSSKISRKYIT